MANIQLRNLCKIYSGNISAVKNISLDVADREFLVLVGPSGCGKSTILRLIAGLEEPTSGEILIDGKSVRGIEPKDRNIAMVFQNYALYPHLTAYQNIAFPLKMRHISKNEIDTKVMEVAAMLEITDILDKKPAKLSGGQKQRVAIGRAIVRKPAVLLMDEPLSNLDAKLRSAMRSEIAKLRQRINTTFIYVTHDQTEAMTLGDRIVVMDKGIIQQSGTPLDVYNHPENMFVAGFIGTPPMNFIKPESDSEIIGIRPENIILGESGEEATVEFVEMLGSSVLMHLRYNGQPLIAIVTDMQNMENFISGSKVHITFMKDKIHKFKKQN